MCLCVCVCVCMHISAVRRMGRAIYVWVCLYAQYVQCIAWYNKNVNQPNICLTPLALSSRCLHRKWAINTRG